MKGAGARLVYTWRYDGHGDSDPRGHAIHVALSSGCPEKDTFAIADHNLHRAFGSG
jgi:hypothetical protein